MGKEHCRVNLEEAEDDESNEFRDFYKPNTEHEDWSSDDAGQDTESGLLPNNDRSKGGGGKTEPAQDLPRKMNDSTLHLSSGKILSIRSRTTRKPRHRSLTGFKNHRGGMSLIQGRFPPVSYSNTTEGKTIVKDSTISPQETRALSLTRAERRIPTGKNNSTLCATFANTTLRERSALTHLSPAAQQAMVIHRFK